MAQIKNNQVKFGVNVKPTFANPSFRTQTTTPMSQLGQSQGMTFPSMGALGVTPKLSKSPTPLVPGTNNYTPTSIQALGGNSRPGVLAGGANQPNISTATPQNGQTAGPAINNTQQSIGVQQNGINSRGGIDKPNNPNQTSSDTTFRGILDTLLGKSNPTNEQERARREMERISAGNKAIGDNAAAISQRYGDEIARVGGLKAGAVAGNLSTGTNVVGSGNAAIASQSASARMQSLAEAQQAALKGTEQQLTAQEQQANAFNPSLQASLTQQQLGLSGVGTAAGLAAPSVAPYGQTSFNPLTPGFAGGNMDPQTQASNIAQQLMSGQLTYDQAIEAMGYAGTAGTNFLNQALSSMGANPLALQAQGTAAQTNLQTTGTATTGIARAGLEETTRNYNQLIGAADAAHRQAANVNNILDKTGLNDVSSTDYNKALNNLQRRFSSTDFAALQTALNEAQIMYTNLLSTGGGTPTGNENNAITALNINQSASAIKSSIQQLENAAANRLQAQQGIMQQYQQNLNSGSGMTGGNTGGGGTGWDAI